jgi:hypothetical protein
MKLSLLFSLSIAALTFSASAHANEESLFEVIPTIETSVVETTSPDQLRILGKGLTGKTSHESLALACVGENYNCDTLQFIYFKAPSESEFIGPRFKFHSKKDLKKTLKTLSKNAEGEGVRGKRTFVTLIGVIGVLVALTPILDSATPAYFAIFAPFLTGMMDVNGVYDLIGNYKSVTNTESGSFMTKQDGWNWSQDSHAVREKAFQKIVRYVKNPNGFAAQIANR